MNYRFGPWRIAPQARELWRDGELQPVARRVFECLAYLIEHRERAVGRDELVAALWGRVDVADVLVSQLVARTRKAIGDDAREQRAIRTIAGFGYRWVMPLDEVAEAAASVAAAPSPETAAASLPAADVVEAAPTPVAAASQRRAGFWLALASVLIAVVAAGLWRWHRAAQPAATSPDLAQAVVVLPFEVPAGHAPGWLRLGGMDMVGERLRAAGLAVPPSESVLVALQAQAGAKDAEAAQAAATLGATLVVRGRAEQTADGWRVELTASDANGGRHSGVALRALPAEAVRQAGDLLLAALGHAQAGDETGDENDALDERLQRVQAAVLANEFGTAREILDQADPAERNDPRLRFRLAQIDYHEGRLDAADATMRDLLADPNLLPRGLQASILVARGMLAMRRGDCAAAESSYAGGVTLLESGERALDEGNALAGRGLARTCLGQYAAAANDLGLARTRMAKAGDRLGLARIDNYFGLLDADRNRLADALVDFRDAAAAYERFGAVDALRAALGGQLQVQADLLQHAEALATSERLWALRDRVADVGQRLALDADRARALLGVGRLQAAAQVLATSAADLAQPAQASYARDVHAERAHLAALQGDPATAIAEARAALEQWPGQADAARRDGLRLLLQRELLASAQPLDDAFKAEGEATSPTLGVVQAEAAQARGDAASAERLFKAALAAADAEGVPATTVRVASAYAGWLLAHGRAQEAAEVGGRVARWAERDFDSALLQVALYRALGRDDLRLASLKQAQALAGERPIPPGLRDAASFFAPPTRAR